MIVGANCTPDFFLPQLAERKGALDQTMRGFLEGRRRAERKWKRGVFKEMMESYRPSWT